MNSRTKYFGTPQGCNRGQNCKFSHESQPGRNAAVRSAPAVPQETGVESEYRKWQNRMPRPEAPMFRSNHRPNVSRFFALGWELTTKADIGTKQRIVIKLATESGLQMIKASTDAMSEEQDDDALMDTFTATTLPFFRTVSHADVTASLLLEKPMTTICNFLFGSNGRRLITTFRAVACAITALLSIEQKNGEVHIRTALTASLALLRRIVESSQTAQVLEDLKPILQTFAASFPEEHELHEAQEHLRRIQCRYNIGQSMPDASVPGTSETEMQKPRFGLEYDLPGALSTHGPRHDNDSADIQGISILPTSQEIQSQRLEFLPPADGSMSVHAGLRGLLDRQFRLLREDSIGGLRDAIHFEIEKRDRNPASRSSRDQVVRHLLHHEVRVRRFEIDRRKGLQIVVDFAQPEAVRSKNVKQRLEWWTESRRMQQDALVCLVSTAGRTIFFTICNPEPTPPTSRKQANEDSSGDMVSPADEAYLRKRTNIPSLHIDPDRAALVLTMVDFKAVDFRWLIEQLERRVQSRDVTSCTLVEFPNTLLPSFKHTLQALQEMSQTLDLPFRDLLAPDRPQPGMVTLEPPSYAQRRDFAFDLSPLIGGGALAFTPGQSFDLEQLRARTRLDPAQQHAILHALSNRMALIQGPPGTGKSYTGVALIKTLLRNRRTAKLGPIICVCYTNHALDQLLESLVRDGVNQLIRIGSRSESELLSKLNLRQVAGEIETTREERRQRWECNQALDGQLDEIEHFLSMLNDSRWREDIRDHLKGNYPNHYRQLFETRLDEEGFEIVQGRKSNYFDRWLAGRTGDFSNNGEHAQDRETPSSSSLARPLSKLLKSSLHNLSILERKSLHDYWLGERLSELTDNLLNALESYDEHKSGLDTCRQEVDLRCLLQAHVIGCTTSGLARNLGLLRKVRAKVVVCEEAGEVLEAHTLTALLPSVEHAILIGDHEQLRPQIKNYELQHDNPRGERFALDVSLFERLVRPRRGQPEAPFASLRTQRRMHPSISELVRTTIYPNLEDHKCVSDYPEVVGIRKRLFWLDHRQSEDRSSSPDDVKSTSKSNAYETEVVAALVSHLVRQGAYDTGDIVVLTPYLGQLRKIRRRLGSSFEILVGERDLEDLVAEGATDEVKEQTLAARPPVARKTSLSKALRVASVDNFQGEEAKIIVISLVRSNDERRCGFLKTSNRINVLLSRARHGMYIVGDSDTASSVQMWADVLKILHRDGNIGPKLDLCCPRHKETMIEVQTPDDFAIFSPEGGCTKKCGQRLECGHACVNQCHSEALHMAVRCLERCQRSKPGCAHPCPKHCGDPCDKKCQFPIENVKLPCGHVYEILACHKAQATETVSCRKTVPTRIPDCGHVVETPCCMLPLPPDFRCPALCGQILDCGHPCTRTCIDCRATGSHGDCKRICERPFATCKHVCKKACHGDLPCPLCENRCEVRCSHSRCSKKCSEPCVPCVEDCAWSCPHRGKCPMPCAVPCDILPCSRRCPEHLTCGHQCPSVCGEICPDVRYCQICSNTSVKEQVVDYIMQTTYADTNLDEIPIIVPSCGHIMTIESMDEHMNLAKYFHVSDDEQLEERVLGLKSLPEPFSAEDLKNCPLCRTPIRNLNRYGRIVRRAWIDEATKKFIVWANAQFVPLTEQMRGIEVRLKEITAVSEVDFGVSSASQAAAPHVFAMEPIKIKDTGDAQIRTVARLIGKHQRYKPLLRLYNTIFHFLRKVSEDEQPFSRVYDLVRDARVHRGVNTDFEYTPEILQTRNRLLATVLMLRCVYAILTEFCALYKDKPAGGALWMQRELDINLSSNRQDCEKLIEECRDRNQPANQVEGLLFWARFAALERAMSETREDLPVLVQQARKCLVTAKDICNDHPGTTRGMLEEIGDVETMLRDSTFYSTVTNDEKAQVYAAMAREFRGTGHWYYCANGHPFTVGECGMPMQTSVCPQCGSPVGGRSHESVEGVRHATDLDAQFGRMRI